MSISQDKAEFSITDICMSLVHLFVLELIYFTTWHNRRNYFFENKREKVDF